MAKGMVDAFISAGNTGAMMVGSLFSIKAIEGIHRPTIGAYMPSMPSLPSLPGGCSTAPSDALKDVNWEKARIVTIDIRQGAFDPIVLRLRRDEPYLFHFNNRDDSSRTFRSPGFFSSIAVDRVTVGGKDLAEPCMVGINIPARTPVEMRFVPTQDGRYEFEDTTFGIPMLLDRKSTR